jgi:cephalosporin hydroxylase
VTALDDFAAEVRKQIEGLGADVDLQALSRIWIRETSRHRYTYNFEWLGRPIIQFPQDIVALQELIWKVRPDVVVETGIAHGGSLILSASILELLGGDGRVIGVDIDIRPHNRAEIERHPLSGRITLIEGSSVDADVVERVVDAIPDRARVLVILDSNHTHAHVLEELRRYSPLVARDSYLIVFDTIIDAMPGGAFPDRPWGEGDNPNTAVRAFLEENDRFVVDDSIEHKLLITVAPGGYLRCVADTSTTRR